MVRNIRPTVVLRFNVVTHEKKSDTTGIRFSLHFPSLSCIKKKIPAWCWASKQVYCLITANELHSLIQTRRFHGNNRSVAEYDLIYLLFHNLLPFCVLRRYRGFYYQTDVASGNVKRNGILLQMSLPIWLCSLWIYQKSALLPVTPRKKLPRFYSEQFGHRSMIVSKPFSSYASASWESMSLFFSNQFTKTSSIAKG